MFKIVKFREGFLFKIMKFSNGFLPKDLDVLFNLCLLVGALWLSKVTLERCSHWVQRFVMCKD